MLNEDSEPMTFNQIRKIAKVLEIPDFKVLEIDKYKKLACKYREPKNCIIYIPWENNSNMGHYVSCFTENDGSLNYQDSFGKLNECPLKDINRTIHTNKVKYQSVFANNCGYLSLLHLYTHDKIDPIIKRV